MEHDVTEQIVGAVLVFVILVGLFLWAAFAIAGQAIVLLLSALWDVATERAQ